MRELSNEVRLRELNTDFLRDTPSVCSFHSHPSLPASQGHSGWNKVVLLAAASQFSLFLPVLRLAASPTGRARLRTSVREANL